MADVDKGLCHAARRLVSESGEMRWEESGRMKIHRSISMDRRLGLWHVFARIGSQSHRREREGRRTNGRTANGEFGSCADADRQTDILDGGIYKGEIPIVSFVWF